MEGEVKGRAKGGKARAQSLTPEQRSDQGRKMIEARWEKRRKIQSLPSVILKGSDLDLAGIKIPCAIIESPNGGEPMRVLTEHGITTALLGSRSGASKRLKKASEEQGAPLPLFIAPPRLKPFIDNMLMDGPLKPIEYVDGDRIVTAFDAQILPAVCEIWLKARDAGVLQDQQLAKAKQAEILMRGLAAVGIIALVDEATGYQKFRAKDSLAKILEAFVAKELQPWIRKFPPDFYEQMFRLRKLEFPGDSPRRPQYFGILTNNVIYRRLAPYVWKELKQRVAKDESGRAKEKLHQYLTPEIGDPRLRDLITSVTTIMKLSSDWPDFMSKLDRLHPAFNETMQLPFDLEADSGVGF
jgi:hypothetical protein